MASSLAAALSYAKEWSSLDPNPRTSAYVRKLISRIEQVDDGRKNELVDDEDAASRELQRLFPTKTSSDADDTNGTNDTTTTTSSSTVITRRRLEFGTAGLRGTMQAGPLGMNDLVVIQTAQGLARYILSKEGIVSKNANDAKDLKAVVGYDHRSLSQYDLSSKNFAILTKLVFEKAGIRCILLDGFVATPLVSYAVTHLGASAGVMVTASHNPKQDNGYKVYWGDGCQIRPPVDEEISNSILENLTPWEDYGTIVREIMSRADGAAGAGDGETAKNGECFGLSDPNETKRIEDAYFQSISSSGLVDNNITTPPSSSSAHGAPRIAYTALHGVGYPFALRSFQTFHLPPFFAVPSQRDPDPLFSTVPFPNPEERGALDEAKAFASGENCNILLANDPDADRLGVAELGESGEWIVFTGDQIGSLLGHWLWETLGRKSDRPVAMIASTVSSKMLSAMAKAEGFLFEDTLTGFKWIGSRALSLQSRGYRVLLGYEEAIGFSCGGIIPDKDGISALGVVATMAHALYREGKTLRAYLQEIHDKYGEFVCNNGYYRCDDVAVVQRIMTDLRNGGKYFERVDKYDVESVRDLGVPGYDSTTEDKKPVLPTSASSPMISFRFANGCVAQFRASGTEPKFKYYIEMQGKPGESEERVRQRLHEMSAVILEELLHPAQNGLIIPSNL